MNHNLLATMARAFLLKIDAMKFLTAMMEAMRTDVKSLIFMMGAIENNTRL